MRGKKLKTIPFRHVSWCDNTQIQKEGLLNILTPKRKPYWSLPATCPHVPSLSRQWIADQFSSACCLFSSVIADSIITLFDFSRGIRPWTSDNKEILIESENRVVKQWNETITVCEGYCVISTSICCNRIIKEASNSQKSCAVSQGHVRWSFVASALCLRLDASQALLCLGLSEAVGCVHALCGTCLTEQNLDQQASWVPILVVPRFSLWLEAKQANLSAFCFPVWQMRNTLILCQMFQHLHTKKL